MRLNRKLQDMGPGTSHLCRLDYWDTRSLLNIPAYNLVDFQHIPHDRHMKACCQCFGILRIYHKVRACKGPKAVTVEVAVILEKIYLYCL